MSNPHEEARQKTADWMKEDFLPILSRENVAANATVRLAEATEYAAYHIGQIDKKLGQITEALKLLTVKM